ncbi:MAG: glycosyltransferase [Ignavibacteriae bacterium]|nr:glycosyltransferase [Ignavibacteriota bacterium]
MTDPKISVVTPSFNQARFIEENIRSVLAQSYPNCEHIIIDGGSSDGTLEILKKYPHLTWISEPDRGQSHALNKGFRMATGEIIGWLNADDTYCENVFHVVANHFAKPEIMVVCGDGFDIDEYGKRLRSRISRGISTKDFIKYWWWKYEYTQPAIFFRKKVFDEIGFLDEGLHYAMDHDFFIRLSLKCTFHHIPLPLANFRLYTTSKTGQVYQKALPGSIWELHRVSKRYWGNPTQAKYYGYFFSFLGGLLFSLSKNLFFVPGSKSRMVVKRLLTKVSS